MLMVPKKFWATGPAALYKASATAPAFTFQTIDGSWSGGGTSVVTSSSDSIGSAFSSRRVVVVFWTGNAGVTYTCTIGGVSCDTNVTVNPDATNVFFVGSAIVPTGTTATTVITSSVGGIFGTMAAIYTVDNSLLSSPTSPVTASATGTGITTLTGSVALLSGGGLLSAIRTNGSSTAPSITASDASLTNDGVSGTANGWGSVSNAAASAGSNVTWTWTGSATPASMLLVAYR